MDVPTATQVRARTPRMDWGTVGFPAPLPNVPDPLQEEVLDAVEYVQNVTGQTMEAMPPNLERTASKAVAMRTQQQVFQGDQDAVESASDELTQTMSAGNYSESRRSFGEVKTQEEALMVNSWPELNRLLWQLMTPERQAYWMGLLSGEGQPYWSIHHPDWANERWGGRWGPENGGDMRGPWPWGM